jgi:phage gp45-like
MMHRIRALLRVARVRLVDGAGPIQRLQIDDGDLGAFGGRRIVDKVAHMLQFGFASSPPLGSEVVLGALGGDRSQTIALGTNHQDSRPRDLGEGDSCLYDQRGQRVWLTDEGIIVDGAGLDLPVTVLNVPKLRVEATRIECTGDIVGFVDGTQISLKALHDAFNAHKHPGVAAGGASTGLTDHTA